MANGGSDPVTRDGLAAELAKMELRLVRQLATIDQVEAVAKQVITPEVIKEMIAVALRDSQARGWTTRERWMGVVLVALAMATFFLNVVVALAH